MANNSRAGNQNYWMSETDLARHILDEKSGTALDPKIGENLLTLARDLTGDPNLIMEDLRSDYDQHLAHNSGEKGTKYPEVWSILLSMVEDFNRVTLNADTSNDEMAEEIVYAKELGLCLHSERMGVDQFLSQMFGSEKDTVLKEMVDLANVLLKSEKTPDVCIREIQGLIERYVSQNYVLKVDTQCRWLALLIIKSSENLRERERREVAWIKKKCKALPYGWTHLPKLPPQ